MKTILKRIFTMWMILYSNLTFAQEGARDGGEILSPAHPSWSCVSRSDSEKIDVFSSPYSEGFPRVPLAFDFRREGNGNYEVYESITWDGKIIGPEEIPVGKNLTVRYRMEALFKYSMNFELIWERSEWMNLEISSLPLNYSTNIKFGSKYPGKTVFRDPASGRKISRKLECEISNGE